MKLLFSLLFLITSSSSALAFEGVIHCTKTQNGVVTTFDFYVKNNQIAIVSRDENGGYYKILVDAGRTSAKVCIDDPAFEKKGYYFVTREDKERRVTIYNKQQTRALEIDGETCPGYAISTEIGSAIAYVGTEAVDLTGLSAFFEDPVYELLDAFQLKTLPKKIVISKNTGDYSVKMTAEAVSLDASVFEIPDGYEQFRVQLSGN